MMQPTDNKRPQMQPLAGPYSSGFDCQPNAVHNNTAQNATTQPQPADKRPRRMNRLKQVLITMLHSLVHQPECIDVQQWCCGSTWVFEVQLRYLTQRDSGRLIGADGKTLEAMRRVLISAAGRQGMGCHLKFVGLPSLAARDGREGAVPSTRLRRVART